MVKYDLRRQGFSVVEKTPKQFIITLIWVSLTLLMTAAVIVFTIIFEFADNIFINFFVDTADFICDDIFKSDSAAITIYMITWLFIGAVLYLMFKNNLNGKKNPAIIRAALTVSFITELFAFMLMVGRAVSYIRHRDVRPVDYDFNAVADFDMIQLMLWYMIIFIVMFILYMAAKLILSIWVSSDKFNSVKLKVIGKGMPICACKEALKPWHIVAIYLLPVIFMYSLMFTQSLQSGPQMIIILIFMSFFLAFDLTAVICMLYYKSKDKMDYISLDNHIYSLTFFNKAYIRRGDKKTYMDDIPVEDTQKKEIFEIITTCLNPGCENYGVELEKTPKLCQLCGNRKYQAEILANVMTCLNEECENYGQELKGDIEECSLCFEKTGRMAFKFSPFLRIPAIVVSVLSAWFFSFAYWNAGTESLGSIVDLMRNAAFIICVVMGYMSKSKTALIISILSVLVTISVIVFAVY